MKGKLFKDDNSYGATYIPVGSPIIQYSATQDKLGLVVTRKQESPSVSPDYFSSIFTMFDGDLSEQHSSLYGTTRFSTKAKETSWGKGISNNFMQVMSNGAFTGINLSEGGSKPPQNRLESPRGINIWTVEDDIAYAQTVAKAISNDEDIDI